jgi:uncharacterized membrane protein
MAPDPIEVLAIGFAIVGLGFSVLYVTLGFKGIRLGYRFLGTAGYRDPAVELLRERYSRGEISKEEFEEKLRELSNRPSR